MIHLNQQARLFVQDGAKSYRFSDKSSLSKELSKPSQNKQLSKAITLFKFHLYTCLRLHRKFFACEYIEDNSYYDFL